MMGQWSLTLMHHTRGLLFFQDPVHPSNRNAAPLVQKKKALLLLEVKHPLVKKLSYSIYNVEPHHGQKAIPILEEPPSWIINP